MLSTLGREALARKFNVELYQKSNSGTTLRKNPKVQDNRPAVNRQTWSSLQNGYEASKRLTSRPRPLWNQQPNRQQSAVRNRPTPARSPALYGREAAPQSGMGTRTLTSATVRGTRVSRKRDSTVSHPGQRFGANGYRASSNYYKPDSRRQGATWPSLKAAPVAQRFHDPNFDDPRYQPVVLLRIPNAYGGALIMRARNEQADTVPQRRDPPKRQWQSQSMWTRRTNS